MLVIENFMLPYLLKIYVQGVAFKSHTHKIQEYLFPQANSCIQNCQSGSLLENEFLCLEYVELLADGPEWNQPPMSP